MPVVSRLHVCIFLIYLTLFNTSPSLIAEFAIVEGRELFNAFCLCRVSNSVSLCYYNVLGLVNIREKLLENRDVFLVIGWGVVFGLEDVEEDSHIRSAPYLWSTDMAGHIYKETGSH